MKEFIDKLIARLEEYPTYSFGVSLLNTKEYIKVSDLKEIANQLVEEHKGGWIPFDDPTCDSGNIPDDEVLVCREDGTIDFDIYDFAQDDWKYNSKHHKNKVIAWQPLPEPYKEELADNNVGNISGWKDAMMNTFLNRNS